MFDVFKIAQALHHQFPNLSRGRRCQLLQAWRPTASRRDADVPEVGVILAARARARSRSPHLLPPALRR